jgi:hypothetical protein
VEASVSLGGVESLEEFQESLLFAAEPHLVNPTLLSVHRDALTVRAGRGSESDDVKISLERDVPSVLSDVARNGVLFVGKPGADDPVRAILDEDLDDVDIAVVPIRCGTRTVCLLVGHPADAPEDAPVLLNALGGAASTEISELLLRRRGLSLFGGRRRAPGEQGAFDAVQLVGIAVVLVALGVILLQSGAGAEIVEYFRSGLSSTLGPLFHALAGS